MRLNMLAMMSAMLSTVGAVEAPPPRRSSPSGRILADVPDYPLHNLPPRSADSAPTSTRRPVPPVPPVPLMSPDEMAVQAAHDKRQRKASKRAATWTGRRVVTERGS